MIGQTLSHYRIMSKLGEGGMGEVYLAEDTRLDRRVALKVLPAEMAADSDRLARFEREARALAALNHPNIVTIFSVEEAEGLRFFTMELVEGTTLAALIPANGLSLGSFFGFAIAIADALSAAHGKGVTHRDLKPSNVMVSEEGRVKVLDFGLAKMARDERSAAGGATGTVTADGRVVGTIPYMSPEQLQGRDVDHRSDIFALGVVLYEMVTGRLPFAGESPADIISSILRDIPPSVSDLRIDLPRHLGRIIHHCLDKDLNRRYQSTLDIRNELELLRADVVSGEVETEECAAVSPTLEPVIAYRTAIVGRDPERACLVAALDRAVGGHGGLVVVSGEPGVGKTRLVWDLIERAQGREVRCLVGHCPEMEGAPPFVPWVEMLDTVIRSTRRREVLRGQLGDAAPELAKITPKIRKLFPDLPPPLDLPPEQGRMFLFNCVLEFLERASAEQALLLVLEDVHWADEATLLLLRHLAPQLARLAVLVVGTYRDVELDVSRPLASALRELVRERLVERVALARLPEMEVQAMLHGLSGREPPRALVHSIFTETEGNPFFVEEVYLHLEESGRLFDEGGGWREPLSLDELEVPESVRLVVGRRLERLDEDGQKILTAAAVIGRRFSFELLEALGDLDPEALLEAIEQAERLHLVQPSGRRDREACYLFTHELIRQTMVAALSLPRRQRLHARVADAMERLYGSRAEEHASDIASHLYQAGAAIAEERTVRYLTLAGDRAMAASGFPIALRHYENALSLLDAGDSEERADLLWKRGLAQRTVGLTRETVANWREALDICERMRNVERVVSASSDLAVLLAWLGRHREAAETALEVLETAGEGLTADRCRLLATAGYAFAWAGDPSRGERLMTEARTEAERLGDHSLLGWVLNREADMLLPQMRMREAVESGRRAIRELRMAGDLWYVAEALGFTQHGLLWCGQLDEARTLGDELLPLAIRLGHPGAQLFAVVGRGFLEFNCTADLDAFEAFSREGIETWQRGGPYSLFGYLFLGFALLWRGRWQEAQTVLEDGIRLQPVESFAGHLWGGLLLAKACAGDRDVRQLLERMRTQLPRAGENATWGAWVLLLLAVEAIATVGGRDEAAELYPLVLEAIATGTVLVGWRSPLEKTAGIAAAAGGRWAEAEAHFDTALRQVHAIPVRIEQPEVRRWYAWMLLDRDRPGDRDRARTLLEEAIEAYTEIGMPKHVEMAEALLATARG